MPVLHFYPKGIHQLIYHKENTAFVQFRPEATHSSTSHFYLEASLFYSMAPCEYNQNTAGHCKVKLYDRHQSFAQHPS